MAIEQPIMITPRAPGKAATGCFAIISVAIYLVPEGAHFFELFNKMALPANEYMIVQRIYDGWAFFGFAIAAALILTLAHMVATWRERAARWLSLLSFLLLAATQVVFWVFIYPMNALTRNWTVMPDNLEVVRRQWEYAHAVNAGLSLLALALIVAAALPGRRRANAVVRKT